MARSGLSIQGLEIFRLVARAGSVQSVAVETGLSISTVSHHLSSLEEALGVRLMDRSRRPLALTPEGAVFARHVEEGLRTIRQGEAEITAGNPGELRELRFGVVDDFDSEVAPELAQFLARAMPKCTFFHHTRPSHEILRLLKERRLDVGVAARPPADLAGLIEMPLLRDPFVLALPVGCRERPEDLLEGRGRLPLLRYAREQVMGRLIEAHLRRTRRTLPNRFELESNQSILGMVADGSGWAITTPASFSRAKRFQGLITLHPMPGKGFSRFVSLFAIEPYPQATVDLIAGSLRRLVTRYFVEPMAQSHPWLAPDFRVLPARSEPGAET